LRCFYINTTFLYLVLLEPSLIPVREVIHSSFVSTIVSILCLKEQSQEHSSNSGYCGCNCIHVFEYFFSNNDIWKRLKDWKLQKISKFFYLLLFNENYKQQKNSHDVRVRISFKKNALSNSYRLIYNNLPSVVHFSFMPVSSVV
jgi:hypothetical protein